MKKAWQKCTVPLLLSLVPVQHVWADPSAQQTELETTLAQVMATYDPNLTAPAAADYENNLSIAQSLSQVSNDNFAIGAQLQVDNSAGTIAQNGNHNVAGIFQAMGSGDSAVVTQVGNTNYASVTQVGGANVAIVSQQNDNNTLLLNQQNGNNTANVTQLGNSNVTLNQSGNDSANLTFQVSTPSPVSYTYSQSPGSSWTIHVVN